MIGIKAIASYIPESYRDNLAMAAKFGEREDFIRQRLGGHFLPVMDFGMDTSDLAVKAIEKLLTKTGIDKGEIECLVLCTQNPDGMGLPHTSAIVQDKADLPKQLAAFDISLGCSGYVYSLKLVKGFMDAAGLTTGILVTADPYSKIIDAEDRNTVMLFGDAATATLFTKNPIAKIGRGIFSTDGRGAIHLKNQDGKLHMNGRQVYNFAALTVPQQINELLKIEGITHEDIDQYIFHQGSRYIVETLTKRLHIAPEKVPIRMEETGNTVSSSIPLILQESLTDSAIKNILISGFGVGWSWASMIISKI